MTKTSIRPLLTLAFVAMTLSACADAKKELGLEPAGAPDEFSIMKRAPLEMPPDFALRPPMPGAPRPQEQATAEQARETVLGKDTSSGNIGRGEDALLGEANAGAQPNIRQIVDTEAVKGTGKKKTVVKRLLNIGRDDRPGAKVVDSAAEAQRLKDNAEQGKPVTVGETPGIDD